jgi:hypothetical protein
VCGDHSVIAGPTDAGFVVDLTNSECAQPIHLLRHAWETGVDYALLAPRDRTTVAALQAVHQELVAFARARGVLRTGADTAASQAAYTAELAAALQRFSAPDRIAALDAVGCAHGLAPLPGQPACPR